MVSMPASHASRSPRLGATTRCWTPTFSYASRWTLISSTLVLRASQSTLSEMVNSGSGRRARMRSTSGPAASGGTPIPWKPSPRGHPALEGAVAAAADPNGYIARGLGQHLHVGEGVVPTLVAGRILAEDGPEQVDDLVKPSAPVVERGMQGAVLGLGPPDPDAEGEASRAETVEAGQRVGQGERARVLRTDQHAGSETDRLRRRRREGQRHEWVVEEGRGIRLGHRVDEVVRDPDVRVAKRLGVHRGALHGARHRGAPELGEVNAESHQPERYQRPASGPSRVPAMPGSILGNEVRRVEDPEILLGRATYVDNLAIEGVLSLVFVRSPFAHARIVSIDVEAARRAPGVVAVYTAADLPMPEDTGLMRLHEAVARPPLATDAVRFVGDTVVAVVAESRSAGVDAAELVDVEYDPLPAVTDPEAALAPNAPLQFPAVGSNLASSATGGNSADPLEGAEVVVRGRFVNQRVAVMPMEGGAIAVIPGDDGDGHDLTIYVGTQMPHMFRMLQSAAIGVEAEKVRVIAPHVGGAFGAKVATIEHKVAIACALALGRPVKWVETRSENLVAMPHGRGQVQFVELGLRRDGTMVGLRCRMIGDAGAYGGFGGSLVAGPTRSMAQGVYLIPKISFQAAVVLTNTTPMGAFRGAGRPEAAAFLERIVDIAADELDIDPVELRRRNFLPSAEFPYTTIMGSTYDNGDYDLALDEAVRIAGYAKLRAEQAERRRKGDPKLLGIGVSAYVEVTAGGGGGEWGQVEIDPDGGATVRVGTSAHGQGHATSFSMIVADRLGIPIERIRFIQSDTAKVPKGGGTGGSRSLQLGGSAVHGATEAVLAKARQTGGRSPRGVGRGHRGHRGRTAGGRWLSRYLLGLVRGGVGVSGAGRAVAGDVRLQDQRGDLSLRSPRGGGGDRFGDRTRPGGPPRGCRRLRASPEPHDRPGPAARRDRAGRRAGLVRGGRLRRQR